MMLLDRIAARGHEQVVLVADAASGLRAVIAVHSTALGPSLGGVRFWQYPDEAAAIGDALALSEAMTLKAAAAGLDQGGGKAVVMLDPTRPRTITTLRALGRAIDELGGRYIAAEDVGATQQDMDWIALETPWVTGVAIEHGGSGDPSPTTAVGVLAGMRAALLEAFGSADVRGRHVAVQGTGHVGGRLVRLLVAAGARVTVADVRAEGVEALVRELGVAACSPEEILAVPCDVLAPCALGGTISEASIPTLRCRVVAGAANNQLTSLAVGDELAARGIVYAPDYVVNAGGIINIAGEFTGYDPGAARARAEAIEETTTTIFALARSRGISPARAADAYAHERIARDGSGRRWRPGDAAAWTNGAPLLVVRSERVNA